MPNFIIYWSNWRSVLYVGSDFVWYLLKIESFTINRVYWYNKPVFYTCTSKKLHVIHISTEYVVDLRFKHTNEFYC